MRTCIALAILLVSVFGLAACASRNAAQLKRPEIGQTQPKRQQQLSPLRRNVLTLLEKQQYRAAIETMKGRYNDGLEKEYVLAINGHLEFGDDAYSHGNYSMAAYAYKFLLNAYPVETSLKERISQDPKKIRSNLDCCLSRMMEQGLEEYRCGRLENAIRKWKALLKINPGHQEAKKALDTANIQLRSLQNLNNK